MKEHQTNLKLQQQMQVHQPLKLLHQMQVQQLEVHQQQLGAMFNQ